MNTLQNAKKRYEEIEIPEELSVRISEEIARADKRRRGNAITLIQPERLGNCVLYKTDYDELARVLEVGMAL